MALLCISLLTGVGAGAPTAAALTLQQYFFELSDRERGAYITGFLDFFVRDTAREAGYKQCIEGLGAPRLHSALAELVRSDPSFLSYDTMSWLLYEASRLCNQKPPRDLPVGPAPVQAGTTPAAAAQPVEALPHIEPPPPITSVQPRTDKPGSSGAALLLSSAAVLCAGAGAYLFYRHRRGGPLIPPLRRRGPKRNVHSPG